MLIIIMEVEEIIFLFINVKSQEDFIPRLDETQWSERKSPKIDEKSNFSPPPDYYEHIISVYGYLNKT